MNRRILLSLCCLLLGGVCAPAWAEDKKPAPPASIAKAIPASVNTAWSPEAIAHRIWLLTDLVLERHVNPPARQEMLRASLADNDKPAQTFGLGKRMSLVTTEEQWIAIAKELHAANQPEMVERLSKSVPGGLGFIPSKQLKVMDQSAANRYVGTGIQIAVDPETKLTQVRLAFRNGPAYRAGMKTNDLIVAVDGAPMSGKSIGQVVDAIRGEEGSAVTLDVRQPKAKGTRSLKMVRSVVPFETVIGYRRAAEDSWNYRVDPSAPIAYLQCKSVTSSVVHELRQKEAQLKAEGFRGLVLDLRFNPGGRMHELALLGDAFLEGGVMWRTRDVKNQVKEYRADGECLFRDWPVVVLVHGQLDNGIRAVVAAWQDSQRVIVVGERNLGPTYYNELVNLPDGGGAVQLRAGLMERPGVAPKGGGIKPDYEVALAQDKHESLSRWFFKQELPFEPAMIKEPAPTDAQLAKAIEVLKAKLKASGQVSKN
jgi:carboxyl-terminal processing protease